MLLSLTKLRITLIILGFGIAACAGLARHAANAQDGAQEEEASAELHSAGPQNTGQSGLPLPRFVSMAASEAFMRTGPAQTYPKKWIYKRRNLPLKIIDEYGNWRRVEDHDGVTGWFYVKLLSGKRTAMVLENDTPMLRSPNKPDSLILTADEGVIGTLLECDARWCRMEIDGSRGWVERRWLFGLLEHETKLP